MGRRRGLAGIALAGVMMFGLQGCAPSGDLEARSGALDASVDATDPTGPAVAIRDGDLVLTGPDGTGRVIASTDAALDGELVHASVRPGGRERLTVLALARAEGDGTTRYELRYVTVDGDEITELYWFPWRLQVADDLADTLDQPPLPVWAPDGEELAWLEWGDDGTRLRTVGWHDEEVTSNPSDDVVTYRLAEVPAGTQLEAWEIDDEGQPVLRGRDGDTTWRIHLDTDAAIAVAMADPAAT